MKKKINEVSEIVILRSIGESIRGARVAQEMTMEEFDDLPLAIAV